MAAKLWGRGGDALFFVLILIFFWWRLINEDRDCSLRLLIYSRAPRHSAPSKTSTKKSTNNKDEEHENRREHGARVGAYEAILSGLRDLIKRLVMGHPVIESAMVLFSLQLLIVAITKERARNGTSE